MRLPSIVALVFVSACTEPIRPPSARDSDPFADPAQVPISSDAVATLLAAQAFETPSRGFSLSDPPNWVAWRRILLSETAAADFQYLLANATTPEGRMYGVAGILAADPDAWTELVADPRWDGVEVLEISGCVGSPVPAHMLIRELATPAAREYFRTGEFPPRAP